MIMETYEKKYKEALERAMQFSEKPYLEDSKGIVDYIFPELKESEGEKIRKEIISALKYANHKGVYDKHLAWLEKQGEHANFRNKIQIGDKVTRNEDGVLVNLSQLNRVAKKDEKQGEQKPADKVEPKFKVGDWVVRNGETLQISGIDTVLDGTFHYWFTKGTWLSSKKMENATLWTIQDAKDGDVLVASDSSIFIFESVVDCACKHYVALTTDGVVKFNEGLEHFWETSTAVKPATKEQRDLLEKAMADAGYTFDFEKKELKKIEQKPVWSQDVQEERVNEEFINALGTMLNDGLPDRYLVSEERIKESAELLFSIARKQLKNEMQEWSEGDNKIIEEIINDIECARAINYHAPKEGYEFRENWLKSLIPQSQWKPSDEQMEALEYYMHTLTCNEHKEILFGLYTDLKKLREE